MNMTADPRRTTILQGEILALLHDIGKLHWPYVDTGAHRSGDIAVIHTTNFLDAPSLPEMKELFAVPLKDWLPLEGRQTRSLVSLLATHHYIRRVFQDLSPYFSEGEGYHHAVPLIMYADTADSLFSKGSETTKESRQGDDIRLASPLGGVECRISEASVKAGAEKLATALAAWGEGIEDWDDDTLLEKRDALIALLKEHCSSQLAETRLPNNDVSLWQHTWSVASIFKALLAGCLESGRWDGLLVDIVKNGKVNQELAHARQKLSLLALQWNEEAFLARSMRSFEIVGRRLALSKFSDEIKNFMETKLCVGNAIYSDSRGICFLVPCLDGRADLLADIAEKVEKESNEQLHGLLSWKLMHKSCGLRLISMKDFWNEPFESGAHHAVHGPRKPAWLDVWAKSKEKNLYDKGLEVCPRCGLHPVNMNASSSGSSSDKGCSKCLEFRSIGQNYMNDLEKGRSSDAEQLFGVPAMLNVRDFIELVEKEEKGESVENSRLVLIQGVIPVEALCSGDVSAHVVSRPAEGWEKCRTEVAKHWHDADAENSLPFFQKLFGEKNGFATEEDGWCSLPLREGASRLETYIDTVVFGGERPGTEGEQVKAIIDWATTQHPAPSRMFRLWDKVKEFMQYPFRDMKDVDMCPLTCSLDSFQFLVHARNALNVLDRIRQEYESRFGAVQHLLPLHLSATAFRYKAPLYLAMDSARRFRRLAERGPVLWELISKNKITTGWELKWRTDSGKEVTWFMPEGDQWHLWFREEGCWHPVHINDMSNGRKYRILHSSFDFEVLASSTRRYDITYDAAGSRAHYMSRSARPRPYPLEVLGQWVGLVKLFSDSEAAKHQRKTAVELLARIHRDWPDCNTEVFKDMAKDIMRTTLGSDMADRLAYTAADGSFFDICEWHDFIGK